jgi:sodium transport system permease protein
MRAMWIVFSKEFLDIVRNRRRFIWLLVSSFLLFPVLLGIPYALILGRVTQQTVNVLKVPTQGIENAPVLAAYLKEQEIELIPSDNVTELVLNKEYSVGLIIPDDYQASLDAGRPVEVTVVRDLRRSIDVTASRLKSALSDYADGLVEERLQSRGLPSDFLQPITVTEENVATANETTGSTLSLLIPGMIISLSLTAGMPVAVSAIAGEKKKLTLEPVLFTTVSRFQLVFAKLLAVLASVFLNLLMSATSIVASVVVLAVGVILSSDGQGPVSNGVPSSPVMSPLIESFMGYSIQRSAILLFLLAPFLIILFVSALQLLVSAWARNDEEAYTYLAPLNFASMLVVVVAFFLDEYTPQLWHYGMPVFGTILSMRDLLSNKIDPVSLTVMFVSSAVYAAAMLAVAVWMFGREEIVFRT